VIKVAQKDNFSISIKENEYQYLYFFNTKIELINFTLNKEFILITIIENNQLNYYNLSFAKERKLYGLPI
jgi:hypothetical protein